VTLGKGSEKGSSENGRPKGLLSPGKKAKDRVARGGGGRFPRPETPMVGDREVIPRQRDIVPGGGGGRAKQPPWERKTARIRSTGHKKEGKRGLTSFKRATGKPINKVGVKAVTRNWNKYRQNRRGERGERKLQEKKKVEAREKKHRVT